MQTTSPNIRAVAGRPEQAHSDNTSSRSPLATALALAAMSLGLGVVQLDITIVNTALSSIGASLGGSVAELQWVVTAYTIAFAAFILTAGALGDRLGAKRIFMAGFAIFTLASLACALAPSAVFLIVARSVQGLAAAILVPNSLTLLNHAYADPKERGRAVGFWAAGASVALTAGPFVGGVLIALVGWRSIFLVNLPIGAAGLWLAWRYAEETPRLSQREIDLPGQIAAITALGTLAGALIEGGRLGWGHPLVIVGFAAAAVVGFLFVWREARATTDAAALAVWPSHVRTHCAGRGSLQHRLLRPDLRAEPLFPECPWLVAVRNGPRLRAHDGHGAARQPRRRVGQRTPRRAANHRAGFGDHGRGLRCAAAHGLRHELLGDRRSAPRPWRRARPASAALDLDAARQCR